MKAKIINVGYLPVVDQKNKGSQGKRVLGNHSQHIEFTDAHQLIGYINDYLTKKRCVIPVDDMLKRSIHFISRYQQQKNISNCLQTSLKASPLKKQQQAQDSFDTSKQNYYAMSNISENQSSSFFQKKKLTNIDSTSLKKQQYTKNRQILTEIEQNQKQQCQIKKVPTMEIIRKLRNIITDKDNKIAYLKEKIQELNGSIEQLKNMMNQSQNLLMHQNDKLHNLNKQLQEKCKPAIEINYPVTIQKQAIQISYPVTIQEQISINYPVTIQQQNFPIFLEYQINLPQQTPSIKDFYQYGQQTSQMYIDNNTLKQQIQRLQNQQQYLWMYVNKKTEQDNLF